MDEEKKILPIQLVAHEVYQVRMQYNNSNILAMLSMIVVALVYQASKTYGFISLGVALTYFSFIFWKNNRQMKYLQEKYKLEVPKSKFSIKNMQD